MAIAKVADRATVNSNSGVTTADFVLSSLTVGNVLIIRTAAENSGGGGAARTITVTNQSGTAINTSTDQAFQQNNDPGAASAGITCNVVVAEITATSGTVRITYSGSVVQAGVAEEWSGIDLTTPVVGTPVGANGVNSTNLASCADTSVAAGNLAYGAMAVEGPSSDTYTQDADSTNGTWSDLTKAGTTNATADQNSTTYGGYKVVSGTGGQTYNPTINNARDSAGIIVEFTAAAAHDDAPAEVASGSGTANNATTTVASNPGSAAATGTSHQPTAGVAPNAGEATAAGTAHDATVSTATGTNADAEVATANGTAHNVTGTVTASALEATATGTAQPPAPSVAPSPPTGTATGAAHQPAVSIAPAPATATATGQGFDATVSTAAATNADAGVATATGTAHNATATVTASVFVAIATGAAHDATTTDGEPEPEPDPSQSGGGRIVLDKRRKRPRRLIEDEDLVAVLL